MFATYILALVILATTQARTLHPQDFDPHYFVEVANIDQDDYENADSEHSFESVHPVYLNRIRRQAGSMSTNPDGSANLNLKVPLREGSHSMLSAVGSVEGLGREKGYSAAGGGLAFDHVNGHGLSVTGQHIPGLGNQLTAAGRLGLVSTDDHKLAANAFVTRTMPSIPNLPDFSTRGGSLDYTFRDKVGASLSASQTPLFQKTDMSAMGHLNLFRDRSSSLDLSAGVSRSQSPIPTFNHGWRPQAGLTFTKYF